jgi:hypothetical protein
LASEVEKWFKKNKAAWFAAAQEDFLKFTEKVKAAIIAIPVAERPALQDLAAQWGLPVHIATKMHTNSLHKVISAAVILAV